MKLKRMFTSRMFRAGGYSAFAAAMVVAIAVAVNAIVGALPADMTQADLTEQALYTLSDQSRRLVRGLNEDVSLYLLANAGGEDGAIWKLLENYASLSGHVTAAIIDPTREPGFFSERELSQIYANSVLVESGDRSRLIDVSDIYVTDYQVDAYGYGYAAGKEASSETEGPHCRAIYQGCLAKAVSPDKLPILLPCLSKRVNRSHSLMIARMRNRDNRHRRHGRGRYNAYAYGRTG